MPAFGAIGAMDAFGAGWSRWKRLLFEDFHFGTLLKLCLVSLLAEISGGGGFNGNFRSPGKAMDKMPGLPPSMHAALITFFLVGAAVALVIGLIVFYLSCRMKFVEFNTAATGDRRVGPAWNWYAAQTWRLFWTTLAIDVIGLLLLVATAAPMVMAFVHRGGFSGHPSLRQILGLLILIVPLLFAYVIALQFALMVVRDLMLPVWALENAPVSYAWQVARTIVEADVVGFLGYTALKIVMHIVVSIAAVLAFIAALLVSAIPFVAIGMAIYLPLHASSMLLMILLFVAEGIVGGIWLLALASLIFGGSAWLFQCYSVEWVAGRYLPLRNVMYPPPPAAPVTAAPPEPPPAPENSAGDWVTVLG